MSEAPRFTIKEVDCREWPFTLRIPFRFGVTTMREGRQAVVRLRIQLSDGRESWGLAAEALAAKWFDKDPRWSDAENVDQLRAALEIASGLYRTAPARTAFLHFAETYDAQLAEAAAKETPSSRQSASSAARSRSAGPNPATNGLSPSAAASASCAS